MSVVESVVELLLQKLADPFIQEAIFSHGVGDQVEWIMDEFHRMRFFLKDADAKQEGDRRVKNWVLDVRDAAYDAENVIDTFVFKIAALRRRGFAGCIRRYSLILNELVARYKLISEIKRIKIKIREISESRSAFGIINKGQEAGTSSAGQSHQEWRLTSPLSQETDFVGFEKELEMLVARLTEGELRRCVVSVVGMGGLGITTLTTKLYNADTVKKHFHFHAWISVSQEYSARDLLQTITKRCVVLSKEQLELEKMDVLELSEKISEYLKEKRYLVVLDNIWKTETWDALKDAFPDVNNGSRVVLTTRNIDVALYADPRSQPHELRFLTDEESWDLFCKKAFLGRDGGCPQDLEVLGRVIVKKCHGLPLAIAVIGGLLNRKEPWEWENVLKSISWQFVEGESQISHILSLSYKDLPYYLKPCFLYLGNFPEDYEFRAKELIQLWATEGFLKERGELTLEEVGEDSLNELVQRNLVQMVGRSSSSGIKSCRIDPILRDLCIFKAKDSEFMDVHDGNANARACTSRRLAIHLNDSISEYISLGSSTSHLNSVLIYTRSHRWLPTEQEKLLYTGFKLLKVLHLHGAQIKELPREIGRLILLRYLRCTETLLKSLPSSIVNLPSLQTLHVTSRSEIKLPGAIIQMEQLRHLQVKGVFDSNYFDWTGRWGMIEGHPRLGPISSNLRTLSYVKSGKWTEGCLRQLTNLKKLGICLVTQADADVFYESIANMDQLHSLSVVIPADAYTTVGLLVPPLSHLLKLSKLHLEGKLGKLPESTEFPTNLTKLTLAYSCLNEDPMATLEKLRNLRILRLLGYSYVGVEMVCSAQGFLRLESLHLQGLFDLEEWRVEEGAMPSLLHLQISTCLNLKKLPEGLQHVTTLKKLVFRFMPDDFQERLREDGGEDWKKIWHIPSIDINSN